MEGDKENSKGQRKDTGQIKQQTVSNVWDLFKLKENKNSIWRVYCKIAITRRHSTTLMLTAPQQ